MEGRLEETGGTNIFSTVPQFDFNNKTNKSTKSGQRDDSAWTKYIDVLTNTLNQQKEKDIAALDAKLAARGLSRSGAVGAGATDISQKYADALATALAQLGLEKEKLSQQYDISKGTSTGIWGDEGATAINKPYWQGYPYRDAYR